jgi:beta-lactamase superfamily II metal-dependent hydrolase
LNWYGIDKLDVAVVTHWDDDHYGGISHLYREGRTDLILAPAECTLDASDPDHMDQVRVTKAGDSLSLGSINCDVIWPMTVTDGGNEDSLVMLITVDDYKILLTGDIGEETEKSLIKLGKTEDCDILKAAHHGSRYSSCRDFIKAVSPEICVISCGKNNSYGHPHGEVVEILSENCVNIKRTDLEGSISFEIN